MNNAFRYFKTSPEIIRLAVMMYIRYPLSLRQAEDVLFERGIDVSHETIRYWWNRLGPKFSAEIRKRRVDGRNYLNWRWLNNRAENSHLPFRRREGAMARFRDIKTLQKFAAVHGSIYNHFNHQRDLNHRQVYLLPDRKAALGRRRLCAASLRYPRKASRDDDPPAVSRHRSEVRPRSP